MKRFVIALIVSAFVSCTISSKNKLQERFSISDEASLVTNEGELSIAGTPIDITIPEFEHHSTIPCRMEDLFDSLRYVKLETKEDFVVGDISEIEIYNDTIYIVDKSANCLFLFSKDGDAIRKIGKVGNGPGEFSELTSLSIDQYNIYIYDQWQTKVVKYDHYGSVCAEYQLPFFCQKIVPLQNGVVNCFGLGMTNYHLPSVLNYCFWQSDSCFSRITKVGLFSDIEKTIINSDIPLHGYNDSFFYFHNRTNDFYEIKEDGNLNYCAHIKFDPEFPEEFYTNISTKLKELQENDAVVVNDMFKTSNHYIIILSGHGFPTCYVYYNILDENYIMFNNIDFSGNMLSKILGVGRVQTIYNDWIVYRIRTENVQNIYNLISSQIPDLWADAPEHVREFDKKLLESIHDEDNPILVFAKIKDHFN